MSLPDPIPRCKTKELNSAPAPELQAKGARTNFSGASSFKIWRAREREPIMGSGAKSTPSGSRGAPGHGSGGLPNAEAESVFAF